MAMKSRKKPYIRGVSGQLGLNASADLQSQKEMRCPHRGVEGFRFIAATGAELR